MYNASSQAAASSSSTPAGSSTSAPNQRDYLRSGQDRLDQVILELGKESLLFPQLLLVDGFTKGLDFPELLLEPPDTTVDEALEGARSWANISLNAHDKMFGKLHEAIGTINTWLKAPLARDVAEAYEAVRDAYQTYTKQVCSTRGEERIRLIEGPVYLIVSVFGKLRCRQVDQQTGRNLVSRTEEGLNDRKNADGLNLANRWNCLYFKRPTGRGLEIGREIVAEQVAHHCVKHPNPPHVMLGVCRNVFTRRYYRNFLPYAPPIEGTIHTWVEEKPERKFELTFRQERCTDLIQIKKEVAGETLKEMLIETGRLPSSFDRSQFTLAFLWELLVQDSDGTWDNFVRLIRIDCEQPFGGTITWTPENSISDRLYLIAQRTLLYLFPEMKENTNPEVMKQISALDVEKALVRLLADLSAASERCLDFVRKGIINEYELDSMGLPVTLPPHALPHLYRVLTLLKEIANSGKAMSHWDLLRAAEPLLALAYKRIVDGYSNDLRAAQDQLRKALPSEFLKQKKVAALLSSVPERRVAPICLPVREALVRWVESELKRLEDDPQKQYKLLLEIGNHFSDLDSFVLDGVSISAEDLEGVIKSWTGLRSLTLANTKIDYRAISSLVGQFPKLVLTLGENEKLGPNKLKEVIEFAREQHRELLLLIDGERLSCLTEGHKILHKALAKGHLVLAQTMYVSGDPRNKYLQHRMAGAGCKRSIEFLAQRGFSFGELHEEGDKGPLHFAAEENNAEVIEPIRDRLTKHSDQVAPLDALDGKGRTPLHLAALNGHVEVAKELICLGANRDLRTRSGQSLLHLAAITNQTQFMRWLIEDSEWTTQWLEAKDSDSKRALHWAVSSPEATELLVKAGADVNAKTDNLQTPLHYAVREGAKQSVSSLLRHGAMRTCRNQESMTPLSYAIDRASPDAPHYDEIGRLLLFAPSKFQPPKVQQVASSSKDQGVSFSPRSSRHLLAASSSSRPAAAPVHRTNSSNSHIGRKLRSFSLRHLFHRSSTRSVFIAPKEGDDPAENAWLALKDARSALIAKQWSNAARCLECAAQWVDTSLLPAIDLERERLERKCCEALKIRFDQSCIDDYDRDRTVWEKMRTAFNDGLNRRLFVPTYQKEFSKKLEAFLKRVVGEYIGRMEPAPGSFAVALRGAAARREMLQYSHVGVTIAVDGRADVPGNYYGRLREILEVRGMAWSLPFDVKVVSREHAVTSDALCELAWLAGDRKLLHDDTGSKQRRHRVRKHLNLEVTGIRDFVEKCQPETLSNTVDLSQFDRTIREGLGALVRYYASRHGTTESAPLSATSAKLTWLLNQRRITKEDKEQIEGVFEKISIWRAEAQRKYCGPYEVCTSDKERSDLLHIQADELVAVNQLLFNFYASIQPMSDPRRFVKVFALGLQGSVAGSSRFTAEVRHFRSQSVEMR